MTSSWGVIASPVRPDDEASLGVLTNVLDGEGVLDTVEHVGISVADADP